MSEPIEPIAEPGHERLGRAAAVLVVGAPLVMALARVLLVPLDDQDWDSVMTDMAANRGRSDTGWLLAIVASGLLTVTAMALARQLQLAGRVRSAVFAVVATATGWAGCASIALTGTFVATAAKAPDRAAQVQLLDDFNGAVSTGIVFLMCVLGAVGYVVLAFGLARAGLASKGAAVLIGLGGATTLLTMPGPLTPLLVAVALLLAAGHTLALRSIR